MFANLFAVLTVRPSRAGRCRPAWLGCLGVLLCLGACHGVDPLLANPPPPTRPDAVLGTPDDLRQALAEARQTEAQVRALLAQPVWSDALSQDPAVFAATLQRQPPALAALADQAAPLQAQLGALFTQTAALSQTAQEIRLRLQALDTLRQHSGVVAWVQQRQQLLAERAEARRQQARYSAASGQFEADAARQQGVIQSGKVERIDYVDSSGKVVASRYTAAHDDKQRARLLLPFANAAAREMAEQAAAEQDKALRAELALQAHRSQSLAQVEQQLFTESDLITERLWPRLEAHQQAVRQGLAALPAGLGRP